MSDDDLTGTERAELEAVYGVLADRALWIDPSPDLQERVVAAITAEATPGRRRWLRYAAGGVAAAVLLAIGVTIGIQASRHDSGLQFAATLTSTDLAPGSRGEVTLTRTQSGWRIELHATGLPRRANGEFYEAWLKSPDGQLVPIGTFNDGRDVVLWAGVGPADFPLLTITREVADGNQASSGEVVLSGKSHQR